MLLLAFQGVVKIFRLKPCHWIKVTTFEMWSDLIHLCLFCFIRPSNLWFNASDKHGEFSRLLVPLFCLPPTAVCRQPAGFLERWSCCIFINSTGGSFGRKQGKGCGQSYLPIGRECLSWTALLKSLTPVWPQH